MVESTTSGWDALAGEILEGRALERAEAREVLQAPDDDLRSLLWAAFRVRERAWGRNVKLCVLQNARSGLCPEDCSYCSQSKVSTAPIEKYPLLPTGTLTAAAREAVRNGARRYCMVTSGRGPSRRDVSRLADAAREIHAEFPELELCASVGLLEEDQAISLREAGIGWVNHNLNTSERFHPEICTTHAYADRVRTIRAVQAAGMKTCCGGILGMGEGDDDVIDLAFALRELEVDSLPVNLLHAIDGTPLEGVSFLDPVRALKALCLFRFANPTVDLRAAGGREKNLGAWQSLALFPANSIFVRGYLTTPGQDPEDARRMVAALGFDVEEGIAASGAAAVA